jgi:endonuclease IV
MVARATGARRGIDRPLLIGAHVSPAGGPAKAVARGVQRGARAIQIFNQNPRAWKPRVYSDEEVTAFRAAMDAFDVDALLIHAVYLLNCASQDPDVRAKSLASLTSSLRAGTALGARAVVLHPGSALGGEVACRRGTARRRRPSRSAGRFLPAGLTSTIRPGRVPKPVSLPRDA